MTDNEALGEEIARMAAHLDAATHHLLTCVRRFDESGEWERQGALSCAHWLSWRIGLDTVTAREKVRVARALGTLPAIDGALREGRLSYAKVRALSRVATPENEGRLLELALASTGAQLERICRSFRRVVEEQLLPSERGADRRYVRDDVLPSGMVRIEAVLHADEAAIVMKAIEAARAVGQAPEGEREGASAETSDRDGGDAEPSAETSKRDAAAASAETWARPAASLPRATAATAVGASGSVASIPRVDALVRVAESFLSAAQATSGTGGDRYQIFVHLEQDPLGADGALAATLDDGTRVSAEAFRRISCDASLVTVTADTHGNPLDVGRRTRTIPPSLRRALWSRDRGCSFPACSNKLYVHAHHIDHWAHGGETNLANLVLLCSTHHRLLHEGGYSLRRKSGGELVFRDARGRVSEKVPRVRSGVGRGGDVLESLANWILKTGVEIDSTTNLPAWDGTPVDFDAAVGSILDNGLW